MQSHRILFYGAAFLLLIWTVFDGGNGGLNGVYGAEISDKFVATPCEKYEVPEGLKDLPEGFTVNCDEVPEGLKDLPEGFTNDKHVSCDVRGEIMEGENPDQCWAFQGNNTTGQRYKDTNKGSCCHTVDEEKSIPEYLKDIVKLTKDEM